MNLINSEKYSDLKSQTNVIKMISELYNEDMSIDPKKDFKKQVLSNIQRRNNGNNILLVNILFIIIIHELEIKEISLEFKDTKDNIWAVLKKDQKLEIFDLFINNISCIYNTYDSDLIKSVMFNDNNIYDYINNFKTPSLIEDKILKAIPLNYYTMLFYVDFLEYLDLDVDKFINLFSSLDFQDNVNLDNIEDDKNISLISMILLIKQACLFYYSENTDQIDNLKFNDKYLDYILSKYINNYKCLDLEDLQQLHYFKSSFISCFIERELFAMYENENTHLLLDVNDFSDDKRKDFFGRSDKIKNIINASDDKNFHRAIFNFLFDNFPIDYSILFINSFMADFINSDFLEKIRLNKHNIDDFNVADSSVSSITFKNKFNKTINFLLSGDIEQKIKQYLIYQESPFNYHIFISDFINIYNNQYHYIHNSIKENKNINLEKNSNETIQIDNINKDIPLKLSEYSNYKIDKFIQSVYMNNSEKFEKNKEIGNFCLKLNIRQFQYCIDSIVLYHKNNNLIFNIDDKKNMTLNILTILSENKINNYEEYRSVLIYSISGYSKLETVASYKPNNNISNKYDAEVLKGLEDLFNKYRNEEKEDNASFEENNKTEEEIKKMNTIDQMIISIYENNKLNTEDKSILFAKAIKYMNTNSFEKSINSLRLYHINNNKPLTIDDKKNISCSVLKELSDVITDNKVYNLYQEILLDNITGFVDLKDNVSKNNKQEKPITIFSEDNKDDDDINLRPVDNIMEIINEISEELSNKGEKNYVKEAEPKEDVVSDEPLYEIFSAESEIEIQSYADDLGDEGKGVKNQLRRIRKTGNNRYLQSSSKFFEKVDKLRDNFPNFEEFITSIEDYSILNQLGDNHFYIPPSLLVGDPGIGKTFFLSELSDTIGIENKMIHMETISASWLLVGASSQWKDAKPGIIYDNIIKSKYANNIFILDELDKMMKSNYPVDNCLLQLFEKHTAKEFKDEYIPLKLDISKIIWLATANTLSTISEPILSRLQTYKIANPNFIERKKLAQNIYNHMLAENTWGNHFNPIIPDATLDKLCEPSDSIREMKKVLLKAITHSARRKDNTITIEDIISVNTTSKNKIGFM